MPGGNDTLVPLQWQPVPGCSGAQIYPFIRKIDTVSSNSYLVQTPDAILLIDPGGLPEQAAHLMSVASIIRAERERPLFVFLTHVHVDHYASVLKDPAFAFGDAVVLGIQEDGAVALESGDRKLTQAELLGTDVTPIPVKLRLFPHASARGIAAKEVQEFRSGARIAVTRDTIGPEGLTLRHERIEFGPGPAFDAYHTPGHSPDSTCFRIGNLLFIGDVLFASAPGIAGQIGWSQEALIRSLDGLIAFLSSGEIAVVLPGHGHLLPLPDTLRMLAAVRKDAVSLANIVQLDHQWALETAAYAEDCMDQVNELFTVMAGRLYYVIYVLEELGESDVAGRVSSLIGGDVIDDLLEAFTAFAEEHHAGRQGSVPLALKAGQVISKLQRAFKKEELAHIIDPMLVLRAQRLLSDYTTILRGFSPPRDPARHELCGLLDMIITGHSVPSCSDDEFLDSADDAEAFAGMLLARIGMPPLLEDIRLAREDQSGEIFGLIDKDHFSDLVTYLLEDLVGTGAGDILIRSERKGKTGTLSFIGRIPEDQPVRTAKPRRFLTILAERAGVTLAGMQDRVVQTYVVSVEMIP